MTKGSVMMRNCSKAISFLNQRESHEEMSWRVNSLEKHVVLSSGELFQHVFSDIPAPLPASDEPMRAFESNVKSLSVTEVHTPEDRL